MNEQAPFDKSAISRRQFLKLTGAGLAASAIPRFRPAGNASYRVGVGVNPDPYTATLRALEASGSWSAALIYGRTILIKPNLVVGTTPESGIVTDPQVVRAIVDSALHGGAFSIKIIEGYPGGGNFTACGYDFLQDYGGLGRVSLVDLNTQPVRLAPVPGGLAYRQIYLPELIFEDYSLLVSVGKLKCHAESVVTLATKNVYGLPPVSSYTLPAQNGRFAMHERGVHQAVVDMNLARPIDFAVVDGIWGMEGLGPWSGTPVRMNLAAAGQNPVAVDRVCLSAMEISQSWAQHLTYAARLGLGPASLADVEVSGDSITPRAFAVPFFPPLVEYPRLNPSAFYPAGGQQTVVTTWVSRQCTTRAEIVIAPDTSSEVTHVRWLHQWTEKPAGIDSTVWDGRDDAGALVAPGTYLVRIEADGGQLVRNAFATSWVEVLPEPVTRRIFLPFVVR